MLTWAMVFYSFIQARNTEEGALLRESCQLKVGVLSDTHGLLRPEVLEKLQGADMILHAGDVCSAEIPAKLREIAPLFIVRGNNDSASGGMPARELIETPGGGIYLLHNLRELDIDPWACGVKVVVSGHTHRFACEERGGVLYANPGACGHRRFSLPLTMAWLEYQYGKWSFLPVELKP